jgi:hypothetical protein
MNAEKAEMELVLKPIGDFRITGEGGHSAWKAIEWSALCRVGAGASTHATRFKTAYSPTGLYFLFDCQDHKLTCTGLPDNGTLFTEDVVEVFLWPDERHPLYFEYEISPLGAQLPILVSNNGGAFHGWLPWHHEGPRRCQAATVIRGGDRAPGSVVEGWTAEFFIPFALFSGVCPPPAAGDRWCANLYRIDYDESPASHWAWDTRPSTNFHDYARFGKLIFK